MTTQRMRAVKQRLALASIVPLTMLIAACFTPEPASKGSSQPSASNTVEESASFEELVTEYLRRFPYQVTYDYTMRYTGGDPAKLNVWAVGGEPALVRAGADILPRTNNDTYIKGAALLLEEGPVVLESSAPSEDRFSSIQLVDDRNANYRNIVHPQGRYTLYFGERPREVEGEAIEVPSKLSVVIVRVEVRDKTDAADVAAAKALFNGMTIHGPKPAKYPPEPDLLSAYSADVVAEANRRMDEVFATIPFLRTVVGPGQEPGTQVSHLYHSAGTKVGWGGADPAHSVAEAILFDEHGDEMKGRYGAYAVTTREPPVDAFWSITVYDTERGGFLHPNQDDRYHINNTAARHNDDGTVTFMFKQACRVAGSNCLEVPAGRFELVARYYLPREEIVSGAWRFPRASLSGE